MEGGKDSSSHPFFIQKVFHELGARDGASSSSQLWEGQGIQPRNAVGDEELEATGTDARVVGGLRESREPALA